MLDLIAEVRRFQQWAAELRSDEPCGEWEVTYPNWESLYETTLEFFARRPWSTWTTEEAEAVLYAIARDNEIEYLASEIRERHPEILLDLTVAAVERGERDAKWQLAVQFTYLKSLDPQAERTLLSLAHDRDEYVRRRTLMTLAELGSGAVEELAMTAWEKPDPHQQWSRMAVLSSLQRIKSSKLESLLIEAEQSPLPCLSDYAKRLRRGEVG